MDVAPDAIDYVRLERLAEQGRELLLTGATEESLGVHPIGGTVARRAPCPKSLTIRPFKVSERG